MISSERVGISPEDFNHRPDGERSSLPVDFNNGNGAGETMAESSLNSVELDSAISSRPFSAAAAGARPLAGSVAARQPLSAEPMSKRTSWSRSKRHYMARLGQCRCAVLDRTRL